MFIHNHKKFWCFIIIVNGSHEDYLKAIYLNSKYNNGGWVSNSEISDLLGINPASVSWMLHKLKNNGYIQ